MSAVPPTAPTTVPVTSTPPQAAASIPQAPEALLRLPTGTTLDVQISQTPQNGTVTVESALGTLTLKTPLSLSNGSTLTMQLTGQNADTALLKITALDGKPLSLAFSDFAGQGKAAGNGAAARPQGPAGQAALPQQGVTNNAATSASLGQPFQVTLLRSPMGIAPGSELTVRLLGTGGQQGTGTAQGPLQTAPGTASPALAGQAGKAPGITLGTSQTGQPAAQGSQAPSQTGAGQANTGQATGQSNVQNATGRGNAGQPQATSSLQNSTSLLSSLQGGRSSHPQAGQQPSAQAPGQQQNAGQNAAPQAGTQAKASLVGQTLSGVVATSRSGGATMIQTNAGLLALGQKIDLPQGAQVTLQVLTQSQPATASAGMAPLTAALTGGGTMTAGTSAWPTLSESLDYLGRIDPQAARQLANAIPGNDPRMLANAVAFNQAVRTGNPNRWLPQNAMQTLKNAGGKGAQLADRLGGDIKELAARSKKPQPGGNEWRTLSMPFADGVNITQIDLISRRFGPQDEHEDDRTNGQGKGTGKRFLINLSLSALGDLQFDGLYKKKSRTLDVILRSRKDLPSEVRQNINGLFGRAMQVLNISGGVVFRTTNQFAGPPPGASMAAHAAPEPDHVEITVPTGQHKGWNA